MSWCNYFVMMPSSDEILNRIITLKKLKNDAGLARFLSVRPAIVSNWRSRGTIPYDIVFSFCEHNDISLDYLIRGKGPIHARIYDEESNDIPSRRAPEEVEEKPAVYSPDNEFVYISQVDGRISAGQGRVPENVVDVKVAFRKDWIRRKGNPRNMVLIKVEGDSMEPSLLSGDLVLVDRNRKYVDPQGGIYALALDDIIMVKRVQMLADRVRIISDNLKYEAFEVPVERLKVNGKVIWFARELGR